MIVRGKNIVIIGGTSGIGLSAAKMLNKQGANLTIVGRDSMKLKTAKSIINSDKCCFLSGDIREEEVAVEAVELCVRSWGGMDALYHVAGGSGRKFGDGPLHEMSLKGWEETIRLNLTSVMLSNRAAIRYFIENRSAGCILNLSSVLGYSPSPKYFSTHAYAAAKAAIIGYSKSIAAYYAERDIRVNVLAPGLIETPMAKRAAEDDRIMQYIKSKQPLGGGRIGSPNDLDAAALFLLSDLSKFVTGQVLAVDGGWSISESYS